MQNVTLLKKLTDTQVQKTRETLKESTKKGSLGTCTKAGERLTCGSKSGARKQKQKQNGEATELAGNGSSDRSP